MTTPALTATAAASCVAAVAVWRFIYNELSPWVAVHREVARVAVGSARGQVAQVGSDGA